MNLRAARIVAAGLLACAAACVSNAADEFDEVLKREAAEYTARLRQAGEELNRARERISREKAPMLAEMREAEDRLIALEHETSRLATGKEEFLSEKRRLLHQIDELRRNNTYIASLATDGLRTLTDGLAAGEDALIVDRIQELQGAIDSGAADGAGPQAVEAAMFLLERTRRLLGGDLQPGRATNGSDHRVLEGTFAYAGPEVFFRPADGSAAGPVRLRDGSRQPVFFPMDQWQPDAATAFFSGGKGAVIADSSGGKALRLKQSAGTVIEYIDRGGKVAYVIVLVGFVALILVVQKSIEIRRLGADTPERVAPVLAAVAKGLIDEARAALAGLRPATRSVLGAGVENLGQPRAILEERIEAQLLEKRLLLERRLPLLAVIATASPLLGLLGTVVGMVRTFSLITVFGTGNAAKLSSGISEVLVATELGLAVAIPTLVIHGFLASRAHKQIALLERHALEFATASEIARLKRDRAQEAEEVGA